MQEPTTETEPSSAPPPPGQVRLTIELQAPPRVRPGVILSIVLVAVLMLLNSAPALIAQGAWDVLVLMVFAVVVVPVGLILFGGRAPGRPLIEMSEDRIRLPLTTRAYEFVTLRYRDITQLFIRDGRAGFVWIGTERGSFVYPLRAFESVEQATALAELIKQRVEHLPDWPKRQARFETQQGTADRIYGDGIPATQILLGIMAIAFGLQSVLLTPEDPMAVVGFGANVPLLVKEGQFYRIVTSNLLHANVFHLVMNGALLLWLGGMVERLLGRRTFISVALLAALLGPLASALSAKASVSVGISSIAFGMIGAFAFTTFKMKGQLPIGFAPPPRMWLTLGLLLAFLGLMASGTDLPAHLGGFLAGVLVVAPLLDGEPKLPLRPAMTGLSSGLIGALSLVVLLGLGWGVYASLHNDGTDQTRATADYLERQPSSPLTLNRIAWLSALDPDASPERLELARVAAHRAVSEIEIEADKQNAQDTLAVVYYRLQRFDEAIDREVKVLEARGTSQFATQVARFLKTRVEVLGVRKNSASVPEPGFDVRFHGSRGFGLDFKPGQSFARAQTVWFLVEMEGELQGLLRLGLSSQTDVTRTLWLKKVGVEPVWHEGSTFRVAWLEDGASDAKGWLMDESVLAYP